MTKKRRKNKKEQKNTQSSKIYTVVKIAQVITGHHTAGTVKNRLAFFQLFAFAQVLAQWANQLLNSLTDFCSHHFQERFCCENEKRNNAANWTDLGVLCLCVRHCVHERFISCKASNDSRSCAWPPSRCVIL